LNSNTGGTLNFSQNYAADDNHIVGSLALGQINISVGYPTTFGSYVLAYCPNLIGQVKFDSDRPTRPITVREGAFYHCEKLTFVGISNQPCYFTLGINHYGKEAFAYCYGLQAIMFPSA
jgi:hypothetical protein